MTRRLRLRINKPTSLISLVLCISLLGGCIWHHTSDMSTKKDTYLAYIEDKYGIKFYPISYSSGTIFSHEEFRCYAEGTNPNRDYVRIWTIKENGKEEYQDDYFGIWIRDEYQRRAQNICDNEIAVSKVYIYRYISSFFAPSLTRENTIDDAIAMGENISATKYIFFEVDPDDGQEFDLTCRRINQMLVDAKLPGSHLFFGLAAGELEHINEDNFLSYLPDMVDPDGEVCLMMAKL